MNAPDSAFLKGQQPCENFRPQLERNEYAIWTNRHECYKCGGSVSFCEHCKKDHHANGYETCKCYP